MSRQTLLLITATVTSVAAFSSPRRKSFTKRGRRDASSSPITTRRVFAFTLAGGAHKMFSTMRHPAKGDGSSSSSSTSLNYRTPDDFDEKFRTDALWQTAMYELREDVDMATLLEQPNIPEMEIVTEKKPKTADSELIETAKAFIPVAIEIGIVADVASAQRPFIFQ